MPQNAKIATNQPSKPKPVDNKSPVKAIHPSPSLPNNESKLSVALRSRGGLTASKSLKSSTLLKENRSNEKILSHASSRKKGTNSLKSSSSVEQRMLSNSPYFKTIADPFNFRGVQIPDLTMYPSVPFSVTDRRQIILDANGNGYVCYGVDGLGGATPHGSLIPVTWVTGTAHNFSIGMLSNSNADTPIVPTTDLFPSGGTVTSASPIRLQQWTTGGVGIPDLFEKVRVVSAGFAVDYAGTDFDNAGTITAAFAPRGSVIKDFLNNSTAVPISTIQNLPDAKVIPVNKNKGAVVLYRPQDFVSLNYTDIQTVYTDSSYGLIPEIIYGGEAYLIITGGTPGKVLQVTTVLNYEGIPLFNTIDLFSVKTSESDPLELSATFNALENVTPVMMGTDEVLGPSHPINTMPQEASEIEHNVEPTSLSGEGSSFMDSIFSALSGVGGPIKEVMKIAKDVTPLVSAAISMI